jgi:hypothetical protein
MGTTHVISGLRNKRARIAGLILADQRAIAQRQEQLAMLDAVILMFSPDCDPDMIPPIRPGSHGLFFGYRELSRLCIDFMREADGPVALDQIVDRAIETKGFTADRRLRKHISDTTRAMLLRMVRKGLVRKVVDAPDTWWELAGHAERE